MTVNVQFQTTNHNPQLCAPDTNANILVPRVVVVCDFICRYLFTEIMLTVTGRGRVYPPLHQRGGVRCGRVIVASSSQFVIVLSTSLIPSPANPIDFITVAAPTPLPPLGQLVACV